eukprot:505520-Pelagomonas_calceolata.AAC.1
MASPLKHNPNYIHYRSKHPQDRIFGAIHNSLSSKFSGFSSCHPIYDDHVMHLTFKHAIYSAILQTDTTATFMFLPSWGGSMSTNPTANFLMLTLTFVAHWEPYPQQLSTMLLPPSGSARKSCFPAIPGSYN